ncbi:MAG: DNA mismatch repair protein MutS [Clostridiaceae bacterium]|nr:DNA mismatch repair protein MutS [Clostridiaceae bacterium]
MSLTTTTLDQDKITPMMQQYLDQKKLWPDCILFFRLGDFYELFFEDAVIAARELELTLTGRDCGQDERAPMCGVPYHAVDHYINRMISRGYKIAICDQVEDPALAKGIVKRDVIRVITPGTVTDSTMLDERRNHYILAIYQLSQYYGLAACDLTTGAFEATALITGATSAKLLNEIARYEPSEILVNPLFAENELNQVLREKYNIVLTTRPDNDFSLEEVDRLMPQPQGQQPLWAQAAVAVLIYLAETQRTEPGHIKPVQVYTVDEFMNLDPVARRNLEITETIRDKGRRGSLLWAIDRTVTSVGGRLLRRWLEQPLLNVSDIEQRLSAVTDLKEQFMRRQELRECLNGLYDLERLAGKVALASVNARDLVALKNTLAKLPAIRQIMAGIQDPALLNLTGQIDPLPELNDLLEHAIQDDPPVGLKEGNLIRDGYHEDVDHLRRAATDGKQWILDLEASEKEKTGIRNLKIGYNRVFGFYLEVTKSNLAQVPDYFIRKQTLANGERYVTTELKEMEDTILGAEQKLIALEYEVFCQIREQVAGQIRSLQQTAHALAALDVLAGLAELAERENYCRPQVDLSDQLSISQGRHPVVEKVLGPGRFIPNDLAMNSQNSRLMILTGPNMAGKSTYMRQIAQIVLLAQIGSYVPAAAAHIGLVDRIFTRVGASDDLSAGQSTFMVEMNEVAQILQHASPRSLLILDEIGRGTSTYDGLSIAWSVIEFIADRQNLGCRTLFATHYHELTDLEPSLPGVFNCHVAVREENGTVVFLHHIKPGGSDDSYGIEVARLAGVPDPVVQRAHEILLRLEEENVDRQKLKIRRNARPMDGQLDLFTASQALKNTDGILDKLSSLDIQQLTPLDAMNILYDLHQKAVKTRRDPS